MPYYRITTSTWKNRPHLQIPCAMRGRPTDLPFEDSEWTLERIAERMGKKKTGVSQRLIFRRFLSVSARGGNSVGLTERRFHEHSKQTEGAEKERFAHVADRLENGIPPGHDAVVNKHGRAARRIPAELCYFFTVVPV
jgi:hypothetical protein